MTKSKWFANHMHHYCFWQCKTPYRVLALCRERGWLKARERQRTDSTHVLAKIRAINRLMCVGEAMRFALNSLAVVAPDWLLSHSYASWVERYDHRIEESRLPKSEADRLSLVELIGGDGQKVLTAVFDPLTPAWLREIPSIQIMRRIWVQNDRCEDWQVRWREAEDLPPRSPVYQLALRCSRPSGQKAQYFVDWIQGAPY